MEGDLKGLLENLRRVATELGTLKKAKALSALKRSWNSKIGVALGFYEMLLGLEGIAENPKATMGDLKETLERVLDVQSGQISIAEMLALVDEWDKQNYTKHAPDYFVCFAYDTPARAFMEILQRFRENLKANKDIYIYTSILNDERPCPVKEPAEVRFKRGGLLVLHDLVDNNTVPMALQTLRCILELYSIREYSRSYSLEICCAQGHEAQLCDQLLKGDMALGNSPFAIDSFNAKAKVMDEAFRNHLEAEIFHIPGMHKGLDTQVEKMLIEAVARSAINTPKSKEKTTADVVKKLIQGLTEFETTSEYLVTNERKYGASMISKLARFEAELRNGTEAKARYVSLFLYCLSRFLNRQDLLRPLEDNIRLAELQVC